MIASQLAEVVVLAGLAGLLLGVIGGGGGGLYVLLLTFILSLPVERAIGTALALSAVTAFAGVIGHWRNRNVEPRSALYLALSSIVGVLGGVMIVQYVPPTLLKTLMVVTFVLIGLLSLARINQVEQVSNDPVRSRWELLLPAGFITGLVSGAFGLSGSTPLSSFLVSFAYLAPALAVGTSLTVVFATSLVGAVAYYQQGNIDFHMLLILGLGSVVGAYLGAKITPFVNKKALSITLAVLALGFGVYLAFHS